MKIKQTRLVRFDGLLKYVWDNNIKGKAFKSNRDKIIYVTDRGNFNFGQQVLLITPNELYTITEEVEITEEMPLDLVEAYINYCGSFQCNTNEHISIRHLLQVNNSEDVRTKFIYLQNEDGSIGELIWKDGKLI